MNASVLGTLLFSVLLNPLLLVAGTIMTLIVATKVIDLIRDSTK